ncbi:MAG: RdgB/HAM1 family non-canonical purine NTP pyrophosphatase [Ruminococcus sp.]|nr:RdgB/HAM1 family non-canonical purine NTP pyrophosphatase [Ruminococcus sp.]
MKLILATNNNGKVREYKEILSPLGFEVISQSEAGINIDVEETGSTFSENAYLKAKAIYDITHSCVLADDSGLEVKALDGRPGIYSARYAPVGERCKKILAEMENVPEKDRAARFVCSICLIFENGEKIAVEGYCAGKIGYESVGDNGFGYDPIFVYENGKTLAQMTEDEKNSISHRGNAAKKIVEEIKRRNDI